MSRKQLIDLHFGAESHRADLWKLLKVNAKANVKKVNVKNPMSNVWPMSKTSMSNVIRTINDMMSWR